MATPALPMDAHEVSEVVDALYGWLVRRGWGKHVEWSMKLPTSLKPSIPPVELFVTTTTEVADATAAVVWSTLRTAYYARTIAKDPELAHGDRSFRAAVGGVERSLPGLISALEAEPGRPSPQLKRLLSLATELRDGLGSLTRIVETKRGRRIPRTKRDWSKFLSDTTAELSALDMTDREIAALLNPVRPKQAHGSHVDRFLAKKASKAAATESKEKFRHRRRRHPKGQRAKAATPRT